MPPSLLTILQPWPTYEWQVEATHAFYAGHKLGIRFHVWVVSRQNGKTALLEAIAIREAMQGKTIGYFAPVYDRAERVYEECVEALYELVEKGYVFHKATTAGWIIRFSLPFIRAVARSMGDPDWRTKRAGEILFKSMATAKHLRGETLDGAILDEAGYIDGPDYRKVIEPMLTAKDGWGLFSGTPPEDSDTPDPTFFRGLHQYAPTDPTWYAIHRDYRAHPSPRVQREIEKKRARTPADEFAREYLATFPDEEKFRLPDLILWGPSHYLKEVGADAEKHPRAVAHFVNESGLDLADNEQELGDKAALVTWTVAPGGSIWIHRAQYFQNPSQVLDALYAEYYEFKMIRILLQKTGFDKGFRHTVNAAEPTRGPLPIQMTDIGGASKRKRIMQMEPLARAGKLFVHESCHEFLLEWEQFPEGLVGPKTRLRRKNHYDMLDAAAPCVMSAYNFSTWAPEPKRDERSMAAAIDAYRAKAKGKRGDTLSRYFRL